MDINGIDEPLQPLRVFILLFIFLPPLLTFISLVKQTRRLAHSSAAVPQPASEQLRGVLAPALGSAGPPPPVGRQWGGDTRYVNNCATPIGKGNKNFPG